eukprot:CAMPEP_0171324226 /NCGR_PEP_ID=MMETSP0816-20121228/116053_1 /TAXON_ID=420281 /ORGANISM="Proboscia inermis, Strain CCAP1064/1" /LENGTH=314 /DNA_ID=CAMNT_0011823101 /DNA_START=462 /DNA_END=1406 /DNA_ORIENTATION=-
MAYSELIWSQLIMLRSCFATPPDPSSSISESTRTKEFDNSQNVFLTSRATLLGIYPSHVTLRGDINLLQAVDFIESPSTTDIKAKSIQHFARESCCQIYSELLQVPNLKDWVKSNFEEEICTQRKCGLLEGNITRQNKNSSLISQDRIPRSTLTCSFKSVPLNKISKRCAEIPRSIFLFDGRLRVLEMQGCGLTHLPKLMGSIHLSNLEVLNLADNSISFLPPSICSISSLVELDISGNLLTALPSELNLLRNLAKIAVARNHLVEVPASICQCKKLNTIDISSNRVKSLPRELFQLNNLQMLLSDDNPFSDDM